MQHPPPLPSPTEHQDSSQASNQSHPRPQHYPFPADLSLTASVFNETQESPHPRGLASVTSPGAHSWFNLKLPPYQSPRKILTGLGILQSRTFPWQQVYFYLTDTESQGASMLSCSPFLLAERKLRARIWLIPSSCLGLRDTYFV